MMTFYKCEIKKESANLIAVTVYQQQDSQTDWYQQYTRHCSSFDRAQEIALQEQKARGADAVLANTAAFMAWNLCAKLTNTTDEEAEQNATV